MSLLRKIVVNFHLVVVAAVVVVAVNIDLTHLNDFCIF